MLTSIFDFVMIKEDFLFSKSNEVSKDVQNGSPIHPFNRTGMAACRAVPCRVMSACYGRVPLRAVSSKSQPRVMPCHVTHFLPLVLAVSWRVMTFKWRVMACRVMACHVPLRAVACRVISLSFEVEICRG